MLFKKEILGKKGGKKKETLRKRRTTGKTKTMKPKASLACDTTATANSNHSLTPSQISINAHTKHQFSSIPLPSTSCLIFNKNLQGKLRKKKKSSEVTKEVSKWDSDMADFEINTMKNVQNSSSGKSAQHARTNR